MNAPKKKSTGSNKSEVFKSQDPEMYSSSEPYGPLHEHAEGPVYTVYAGKHVHVEGPEEMQRSISHQRCYCTCCCYPEFYLGNDIFKKLNEEEQRRLYAVHLEYLEKKATHEANLKLAEAEMYGKTIKIIRKSKELLK